MLTTDVKKHIDAARQVLVGVVPNPTSQIDQITNALIYKFMDDMDQAAIKQGDEPSFFVDELEKYAWTKLMSTRLTNQERMNLYSEALINFSESKQLPPLFRDIFRSAFLPYRDPAVLDLFLKEISYFDYSHSEELGNAYEYLLSIMSSQGDAGQFRTPRHIIDFIVAVVNPTKDDKILDPACGTAGFLISAYKYIIAQHDGKESDGTPNNERPLSPDDRRNILKNFEGYDVDPGMVRISKVNMYLHHFKDPKIFGYNTLASDERWNDKFDVILANPPFMSPKGGVTVHNKFSIESSRSEVLFVDYIMSHLRPKGRAGIIVPEGVIFQSGNAYKQLRKQLVEDGLWAVVSLPSGVFNPYAGVKTSILLFNNELSKQSDELLFVKISNDGFDLGATKRPISKNDLPEALNILSTWKQGKKTESPIATYAAKSKVAETGDYNLSGDRYHVATDYSNSKWPMVELGYIAKFVRGVTFSAKDHATDEEEYILVATTKAAQSDGIHFENLVKIKPNVIKKKDTILKSGDILISVANSANLLGRKTFVKELPNGQKYSFGAFMGLLRPDKNKILPEYLDAFLATDEYKEYCLSRANTTTNISNLNWSDLSKFAIPIPPLEVQDQIVVELNGYRKIIDGAKQIVANWKPKIEIDPTWDKVKLGEVCELAQGFAVNAKSSHALKKDGDMPLLRIKDLIHDTYEQRVDSSLVPKSTIVVENDLLYTRTGQIGLIFTGRSGVLHNNAFKITPDKSRLTKEYLYNFLMSGDVRNRIMSMSTRSAQPDVTHGVFKSVEIPLPPLYIQKQVVEKIETERELVVSSEKLIEVFERKTKEALDNLWSRQE